VKPTRGSIRVSKGNGFARLDVGPVLLVLLFTLGWLWWPRQAWAFWCGSGNSPIVRAGCLVVTWRT
jgi:hypothetical protein